jgi:POT family proton-dependent oligopeptide transporter
MDMLVYPGLRKLGFQFTPIKRITCGFFLASSAMISACVTQYYIYQMSPCGNQANSCEDADGNPLVANISVWVQLLPYGLIGFSEIMASVTSLEYAFTKAPTNMRSTVQAIALFMNALSSALAQALVSLAEDPLLVWNYGLVAVLAAIGGIAFWFDNRKIDKEEEKLNLLPNAQFHGKTPIANDAESGNGVLESSGSEKKRSL